MVAVKSIAPAPQGVPPSVPPGNTYGWHDGSTSSGSCGNAEHFTSGHGSS